MKYRLLDLFCGAGGAGMGYSRAGFEVVGVDINPQPHYPFEFHQADALEFPLEGFDAIHASPPCQRFSAISKCRKGLAESHVDLVAQTRARIEFAPYVIENVVGAPLLDPITLCGSQFPRLRVYRHRLFESNIPLVALDHLPHNDSTPPVGNGPSPKGFISVCGSGGVRGMTSTEIVAYWSKAMGIDWMSRKELAQAIPPAYTEFIGKQLIKHLDMKQDTYNGGAWAGK